MADWSTTQQGQQRSDPQEPYGATRVPDLTDTPNFRFFVSSSGKRLPIHVTSASWDDVNAILTGSLTLTDITLDPDRVTPHNGDQIFCEVNDGGGWSELWRMRVSEPTLTISSETREFTLVNDLDLLRRSEGEFHYRAVKGRHPGGWKGDEIIADVCARFQVPIGALYQGQRRYKPYWKLAISPLEVIRHVVKLERRHTGRRLVIRFDRGKLYVVPLSRSPGLTALGAHLIDAVYRESMAEQFASAVLVKGSTYVQEAASVDSKGRKRKKPLKAFAYVTSPQSISHFGYVRRVFFSPEPTDLHNQGELFLSAAAKPVRNLTLTHPGIPRLRRGDAVRLGIGQDALRRQVVYVYEVHNRLNGPGDFTQETRVIFDDPYVDTRGRSILWKLKQTIEEADAAFPKNLAAGSPQKNNQSIPPDIFEVIDPGIPGIPQLVQPPGFGG